MNKIISIVKTNIWALLVVFVTTLYVFLFAINGYGINAARIFCNITFFVIVSIVCLLCDGWRKKALLIALAVISFIPNIITQSFLLMDHTILKSTDYWVIFNTNLSEANGFINGVPLKVFAFAVLYIALLCLTLYQSIKFSKHKITSKLFQYLAILILIVCCLLQPFRTQVMSIDFYKSFYKYNKEKRDVQEFFANRKGLKIDCQNILQQSPKTMVFVIGESQNRKHMSIYGYPRKTNPELELLQNELEIYTDVVSSDIQTLNCMKEILTFANYEQPNMYKQEASIIEIMRDGGYKTYWIDNQGGGGGLGNIDVYTPTSYRSIAKLSDYYYDAQTIYLDSIILSQLAYCLQDTASNKFICLHLVGNHFEYESRYESSFSTFTDEPIASKVANQLTKEDKHIINHYDNATKYNDYIVSGIIKQLKQVHGLAAMIYISDHGEEVFDTEYYYRRSFERISTTMCEIPFILWRNEEYCSANPLVIETNRPYCVDDIIHSWMSLAGVRYKLYDSKRDIFSSDFSPKERFVQGKNYKDIDIR